MTLAQLKAEYVTLRNEKKRRKAGLLRDIYADAMARMQVKIQQIEEQVFAKK